MTVQDTGATVEAPKADRPRVSGRRSLDVAYHFTLAGTSMLAAALVPGEIGPTLLACLVVWGGLSLVLRPRLRTAGNGVMVAVTAVLLVRNYSGLGLEARGWALVTLLVLATPFVLIPLPRGRGFPFLHIWCLFEGLYVYVSALLSAPLAIHAYLYTPEVRTTGYRVLAVFTAVLVGGGVTALRALGNRSVVHPGAAEANPLPMKAIPRAYALAGAGFVAVGLSDVFGIAEGLGQISQVFRAVGLGGGLILAMLWMDRRLALGHKLALVSAASLLVLSGLGNGALYLSAIPGLLVFALWMSHRRHVPWIGLFIALVVMILLNVGKGEFRQAALDPGRTDSRTALGVDWIDRTVSSLSSSSDVGISNSANRFANSDLLGYTATWAPDRYPYFGYGVYSDLSTLVLPRVLLPDKGTFNISNEFGRKYELIGPSDYATAVNTPLHVEAYLAGGLPAIVMVALFSGVFMAWLGRLLRDRSPATIITGALVATQIMSTVESGILGFALVLPFIVVLRPVMRWACREREGPKAAAPPMPRWRPPPGLRSPTSRTHELPVPPVR